MALKSAGPVVRVASGKRMPGKVSTAISRAPLSLDMTVDDPAMSTATVASMEDEIRTGTSDVASVPMSEPDSILVVESVPPAVELPSSPSSGQSSSVSSQTLAWGDAGDS